MDGIFITAGGGKHEVCDHSSLKFAQQFFIYYLLYIDNIYKSILILHKDIATKNLCHIDLF